MPTDLLKPEYKWRSTGNTYKQECMDLHLPHAHIHLTFYKRNNPKCCDIIINLIHNKQKLTIFKDTIKIDTMPKAQLFASEQLTNYVTEIRTALQNTLCYDIMSKE